MNTNNNSAWKPLKYIIKYVIRIVQLAIFLLLLAAALYFIYFMVVKVGYPAVKGFHIKGDILVKGIPVMITSLVIILIIIFFVGLKILYLLCCMFLMIVNGALGDVIEYLNVTKRNDHYAGYLIFEKGSMSRVYSANERTRKYFLKRWWKRF
jgi:hypothetical protein